jgi:hypothetical protein
MRPIIGIYPPAMFTDPAMIEMMRRDNIPSPISIEHSLTTCTRCRGDGWIGPKQREVAAAGLATVICLYCITKDPELRSMAMITLNPEIDQVPRRFGAMPNRE